MPMKTTEQLQAYLTAAKGDLILAKRLAIQDHSFMDQTLEKKWAELEHLSKQEEKNACSDGSPG